MLRSYLLSLGDRIKMNDLVLLDLLCCGATTGHLRVSCLFPLISALHSADIIVQQQLCELALSKNPHIINHRNHVRKTAGLLAVENDHSEIVVFLARKGANLFVPACVHPAVCWCIP